MANIYKRACSSNTRPSFMRLPAELQIEIFRRMTTTSLLICKHVCKPFRTLIQHPDFEHNNISRSITNKDTSQSLILQFIDKKINYTSHALVLIDTTTKDVIYQTRLTPENPDYVGKLFLVGSCNGLICFAARTLDASHDDILLVWNPVTEQEKYIPLPSIEKYTHKHTMEFYFVPETNDYIILSVGYRQFMYDDMQVVMYSMSTNCWKIVTRYRFLLNSSFDYSKSERATSVFLNGSFHWIFSSTKNSHIVSFNLKSETLALIKTMEHAHVRSGEIYDIGIIDESLALLYWNPGRKDNEISVMTDYGVQDSWVLKYKFNLKHNWLQGCWKNNVMTSDQHSVYFFDTNVLKMKKLIQLPENNYLSGFHSFSD